MQSVMYELMEMCGFTFEAQTFPELILKLAIALCGTAILASIIKVILWISTNAHKLGGR